MDKFWDSLNALMASMGWLARATVHGVVSLSTGQFMPSNCNWCRPAWMIGLGMGLVLIFVYAKGPKTD